MNKRRIRGNQTVVISARVDAGLAARLDWLVRNHEAVEDRAEGIKDAVETWIKAREREAVTQGLFPPVF
jgi:metal-responsive CopG/Arc/MetJ family transcriptional regulator